MLPTSVALRLETRICCYQRTSCSCVIRGAVFRFLSRRYLQNTYVPRSTFIRHHIGIYIFVVSHAFCIPAKVWKSKCLRSSAVPSLSSSTLFLSFTIFFSPFPAVPQFFLLFFSFLPPLIVCFKINLNALRSALRSTTGSGPGSSPGSQNIFSSKDAPSENNFCRSKVVLVIYTNCFVSATTFVQSYV